MEKLINISAAYIHTMDPDWPLVPGALNQHIPLAQQALCACVIQDDSAVGRSLCFEGNARWNITADHSALIPGTRSGEVLATEIGSPRLSAAASILLVTSLRCDITNGLSTSVSFDTM